MSTKRVQAAFAPHSGHDEQVPQQGEQVHEQEQQEEDGQEMWREGGEAHKDEFRHGAVV